MQPVENGITERGVAEQDHPKQVEAQVALTSAVHNHFPVFRLLAGIV